MGQAMTVDDAYDYIAEMADGNGVFIGQTRRDAADVLLDDYDRTKSALDDVRFELAQAQGRIRELEDKFKVQGPAEDSMVKELQQSLRETEKELWKTEDEVVRLRGFYGRVAALVDENRQADCGDGQERTVSQK